ncbi:M23 family metallopeptidase [Kribbella sp. NBC_00359]|uniref:M23 family metallopeptidase n=1 Tax=Kribbella sp. NBC_00359 TaxID=2975966 RepID=UPI002E1ECAFF
MTARIWAVFLTCAVVVVAAGIFGLSSAGVFERGQPSSQSGPVASPTRVVTTPKPTPTPTPSPTRRTAATVHAPPRYVFPIAGCLADASQSHHDYPASDVFAKVGCRFVSPVDGRVDEVTRVDAWDPKTNVGADRGGLSVSVVGVDGVRYYGSHLSAIEAGIRPGVSVRAGQVLARTGKTGSARFTPPHLHFAISWPTAPGVWWIRRGAVPPQAFLNSWHDGGQLSPVSLVARTRRSYGVDRGCRTYC